MYQKKNLYELSVVQPLAAISKHRVEGGQYVQLSFEQNKIYSWLCKPQNVQSEVGCLIIFHVWKMYMSSSFPGIVWG
jgi:hypothetical protein